VSEVDRIADQVVTGFRDGAWPGVSPRDLLRSLSAAEAAAHPIRGAHSAWEIALHLAFWHEAVRRRLGGENVDPADGEDWPVPGAATETAWRATLESLDETHRALVDAVRTLAPERLGETAPGREFTLYFMLHGVPQHDLYHGGQVMLLRKALRGA
jgi:uncharacterized damage-inducible protein DinB